MNTPKIIGVVYQYLNNLSMLPPKYNYENSVGEVVFHSDPRAELQHGTIVANVDALLDFRMDIDIAITQVFGNMCYNYRKPSKQTQHFRLIRFNETYGQEGLYKLETPRQFVTWAGTHQDDAHPLSRFGVIDCKQVVIKPQYGARGSNHVVVASHMVQTLLKSITTQTGEELLQAFPGIILSRGSCLTEPLFDDLSDLVITEKLEHVLQEWRLLFAAGKIYSRERHITPGEYAQSNLCVDVNPNIPEVYYTPLKETDFPQELKDYLSEFVKFIKLPFGSVDLYLTAEGNYGIFEYSEQFGFHGANHAFIRQLHLDGIEQILIKLFNA